MINQFFFSEWRQRQFGRQEAGSNPVPSSASRSEGGARVDRPLEEADHHHPLRLGRARLHRHGLVSTVSADPQTFQNNR